MNNKSQHYYTTFLISFLYFFVILLINIGSFVGSFIFFDNQSLELKTIGQFPHNLFFIFYLIYYIFIFSLIHYIIKLKQVSGLSIIILLFTNFLLSLIMTGQSEKVLLDYTAIIGIGLGLYMLIKYNFRTYSFIIFLTNVTMWFVNIGDAFTILSAINITFFIICIFLLWKNLLLLKDKLFIIIVILNILTPLTFIFILKT